MADIVNTEEDDSLQGDDEILRVARQRLVTAEDAELDIRTKALEDLKFLSGEQWPDNIKAEREREGRPCLVINRLPQTVQQVTNDQRQNRPGIKVHPVSDGASQDTAKIIQGLIRHIEYNSSAETSYDTAFESAVRSSLGYFRITTGFSDPMSFDLEIFIKRIRNQFSVFFDPYSQEPDGSDSKWALVTEDLSKDDYKYQFPNSKLAATDTDWNAVGNNQPSWITKDSARVAEYFYIDYEEKIIHLLKTGEVVLDHEVEARVIKAQNAGLDSSVVQSRVAKIPIVKHLKINGIEILERTVFPGRYIPIIPVYGNELFIDGKRTLESLIRHAKDAQRMYDYWKSAETETIALAPKTPFIMAEGQQEGHEEQWASANVKNHAYLLYKPTTIAGQLAPPPQRQNIEPATQAITQAAMQVADDIKATTGIYDAALGAQSKDISGVAIDRRNSQTGNANFHFTDNLSRSMKHAGRILVDIIPEIYDTPRTARIVAEDGTQSMVRLNESFQGEDGKPKIYSLDVGKYDVVIDTGPGFASKRQEAAAAMTEMSRANPAFMQTCGDLMVKNMDWPGAQEMADRLRLALPPQLQQDPKQQKIPAQVQAQIQFLHNSNQQMAAKIDEYTKIIETKKLDLEHRERVEVMKIEVDKSRIQADVEIALAKLGTQSGIALLQEQIAQIKHTIEQDNKRLSLLGVNQPIETPADFDPSGTDGGNYAGFGHVGSGPNGGDPPVKPMEPNQP